MKADAHLTLANALDAEGFHCAADLARLRHYDCRRSMARELEHAAAVRAEPPLTALAAAAEAWGGEAFDGKFAAYLAAKPKGPRR